MRMIARVAALALLCWGQAATAADIADFGGKPNDPAFDNSPVLARMLAAGEAIEGDGDYWCLSPIDVTQAPKKRLVIRGPVSQYAPQHQEEGNYPGGLRFRVKLASDDQTWLPWHEPPSRRLGNVHLENFTVRVEGAGSGVEIGLPGKGPDGISARGIHISGVYITAPEQQHNRIIADDGTLRVRDTFGLRLNHCYSVVVPSLATRGFYCGWDVVHGDLPQCTAYHPMHSCIGLRAMGVQRTPRPGRFNVIAEDCRHAVIADAGLFALSCEDGYERKIAAHSSQNGPHSLPASAQWRIAKGSDRIELENARSYLREGWPLRIELADAERQLVVRDVGENHATFYEAAGCCYQGRELAGDGSSLVRQPGVLFVSIGSRAGMSEPPTLEYNKRIPGLPLAVVVPGTEPVHLFGNANDLGLLEASNAYAIAANCAGAANRFGTVNCWGRFCAPDHPLAFVYGAPTNGGHCILPTSEWGVGPACCYADDGESLVEFRRRDGRWVRRLRDHQFGWRVPIETPLDTWLKFRVLVYAEQEAELNLAAGPLPLATPRRHMFRLREGWQVVDGTVKASRATRSNDRFCFRIYAAEGVDVSRVEVTQ